MSSEIGTSSSTSPKEKPKAPKGEDLRKDIPITEHLWAEEKILAHYRVGLGTGLTSAQVLEQRAIYGPNVLTPPAQLPAWVKFLLQFRNFFAMLLIFGGILCFVSFVIDQSDSTNLYLGAVLLGVVFITATFSYYQEARSEQIMEGFKTLIPKQCKVLRDGQQMVVDAGELVPGDIVDVTDGDQVPADLRILKATDLKVDNSSLTGESEPQERTAERNYEITSADGSTRPLPPIEATNLLFYTTIVSSGAGKAIVIGTGDNTVMGQIAGLATKTSAESTPINKEIKKFILFISIVAITLGVSFFIIGIVLGTDEIQNVVFAIGIIVANVPEGLLATVTVSLALTAKRMHAKNVLVKNLEAVETLGSTTVIASDKTGTLTQNRMTVQHCWYDGEIFRVPAARNRPQLDAALSIADQKEKMFDPDDVTFRYLHEVAALCNNSVFISTEDVKEVSEHQNQPDFNIFSMNSTSDASESALLKMTQLLRDTNEHRRSNPKLFEIKFNSTNKWQLSIHQTEQDGRTPFLVLKGAPERVMRMCNRIMVHGEELPMTLEWEEKYTKAYEEMGGMGERVLGFAFKKMKGYSMDYPFTNKPEPNFELAGLTFAGLFSLMDPPREGVMEAVGKCKRARIRVFMVTGDHPITAQAIAKQVGIIDQEHWDSGRATVIKGDDIRSWLELPDPKAQLSKWDEALNHEQIVWARVSPAHKLLIVENAQRRGEVVAVTGDGVNDAPALKKGDIGVAMGIAGKDVSKEAADMILMDDNFASIVNGVEEGRLIFDNLKKSIAYTLTSNIPEIAPYLLYITINLPLALTTILILCVDLGTDMVPAISLAYEQKEADIMDRPPRNAATDRLVNSRLISFAYLQIGVIQALAGFYTYFTVLNDFGYTPGILRGNGLSWLDHSILCTINSDNRPDQCGYGCETPDDALWNRVNTHYCEDGCQIPFPGTVDPFVEFTDEGFRGFRAGDDAVCRRNCAWYSTVKENGDVDRWISASRDPNSDLRLIMRQEDADMFEFYCSTANQTVNWGFSDRGSAGLSRENEAEVGSFYWWNGLQQLWPNTKYQKNALAYAQSAYFVSIVVVQWADLLIAKTRKLSIFTQGMRNNFMKFGLCFETVLALLLSYVPPFNTVFGTRPIHALHWFLGVPWSILIFSYDEIRKSRMREHPNRWIEKYTYW